MTMTAIGFDPSLITPKKKPEPIDNTQLVKDFRAQGGQIFHVRPTKNRRGITFAFIQKGRRFEVATAVQHSSDDFTKKIGTKTAIEHFTKGKTVFMPLQSGEDAMGVLRWFSF